MEITKEDPPREMYETTNQTYGVGWQSGRPFSESFTQSVPYKTLTNRRVVQPEEVRNNKMIPAMALTNNPVEPCGILSLSNIPTNTRGEFTNIRRDLYTDTQGLWSNSAHITPYATIDQGFGTYSNLQGAWSRVGPSTYNAIHGRGPWVGQWGANSFEPATLRSLYDHRNVNPNENIVPIENIPQNMWYPS